MTDLLDALDTDYAGREELRLLLAEKVSKYGNDVPEADLMVKLVADLFADSMQGFETYRGGPFVPSFIRVASYGALGASIVAYRSWGMGVAQGGPALASLFANLAPLFAALLSTVVLGSRRAPFTGSPSR